MPTTSSEIFNGWYTRCGSDKSEMINIGSMLFSEIAGPHFQYNVLRWLQFYLHWNIKKHFNINIVMGETKHSQIHVTHIS